MDDMTIANPHIRHRDIHPNTPGIINGPWFCCARVQLGGIGMSDCNECGEPWPCATARTTADGGAP